MNILPKNNPVKFNKFLFEQLRLDMFKHKFLSLYISSVKKGDKVLYDASVLNLQEDSWILILHGEALLIYGENWKEKQFQEISSDFDFNKYRNYLVSGDSALIRSLINFNKLSNHWTEKERVFYRATQIKKIPLQGESISLGKINELNELAVMLQEYYKEEYGGQNNKSIEETTRRIQNLIDSKKIYLLKDTNGEIACFCTLINPDIGIIFTKSQYRRQGKGKMLLSYCSNLLLKENDEIYLMTDKCNLSSNMTCMKLGFEQFFDYTSIRINNG